MRLLFGPLGHLYPKPDLEEFDSNSHPSCDFTSSARSLPPDDSDVNKDKSTPESADDAIFSAESSEEDTEDASGDDEDDILANRRAIRNRNRVRRGEPTQFFLDSDDEWHAQFES